MFLLCLFRCLATAAGFLHYTHEKTGQIVYACMILHNFLLSNKYNIEDIAENMVEDSNMPIRHNTSPVSTRDGENRKYLAEYINHHYAEIQELLRPCGDREE